MQKKLHKIIALLTPSLFIFYPVMALAWAPGSPITPTCGPGGCHFTDLITLFDNLLDVFIWFTIPIATILFIWIGWIFIYEGNKSGARTEAKKKLGSLLKGLIFILTPWLIVKLIVSGLVNASFIPGWTGF
ncbi:hypothetical protein A2442_03405 [Candidatus Campbellbacteria bacterium RIFOXYC2_FULL_35_25]|uniref:Uncharacterized protein n=1 Tax=Candidatus Campbellbacteria bacterium RIFOXYC2_FULL_35_25 TaxID=1797582 RepID=A0A1F5EHS1_9BACT|nr:MAG: hypothetical protein A2442_03405 [Candidatus Campbellbacteria bacterium RIFOXYC2_FULL_35_25]